MEDARPQLSNAVEIDVSYGLSTPIVNNTPFLWGDLDIDTTDNASSFSAEFGDAVDTEQPTLVSIGSENIDLDIDDHWMDWSASASSPGMQTGLLEPTNPPSIQQFIDPQLLAPATNGYEEYLTTVQLASLGGNDLPMTDFATASDPVAQGDMTTLVFDGENRDLTPVMDYGPIQEAIRVVLGEKRSFEEFIAENQDLIIESLDTLQAEIAKNVAIFPPAKRRRHNKKPPTGNNHYGRNGTLSCEACRKRRRKCLYYAEWLPCEYCRYNTGSPCIKLRSPQFKPIRFNATKLVYKALLLPWLLGIKSPFPFKLRPPRLLAVPWLRFDKGLVRRTYGHAQSEWSIIERMLEGEEPPLLEEIGDGDLMRLGLLSLEELYLVQSRWVLVQ